MKKIGIAIFLFFGFLAFAKGQNQFIQTIDSLKREITLAKNDTLQLVLFGQIANTFSEIHPDSAFAYASQMLSLSRKLNLKLEEAGALGEMGYAQINLGNYPRSLTYLLSGIAITSDPENEAPLLSSKFPSVEEFTNRSFSAQVQRLSKLSRIYQYTGILYGNSGNYEKALIYYRNAQEIAEKINSLKLQCIIQITMGRTYQSLGQLDSALISLQSALASATEAKYKRYLGSILLNTGRVYQSKGNSQLAKEFFNRSINESLQQEYFRGVVAANLSMADLFKQSGESDSSFYYIRNGLHYAAYLNAPDLYIRSYSALTDYYKRENKSDSALKYQSFIIKINDSLFNAKQVQQFQNIDFDEDQRKKQIAEAETNYKNKVIKNSLFAGLAIFFIIVIIQFRNNAQKQKANKKLQEQKEEIQTTLSRLKSTQAQLIQSEKMASLGELTAGIAHEIQNPLNFVNNFSEVSAELVDEMKEELAVGNQQLAVEIANDLKENLSKINLHGKRADAIVKGMLEHSKRGSGQKELTNLNALAEEFLRLSHQSFLAKEPNFKCELKTKLDPNLPKVEVIPQDIGRVLLNLINNAFYAVNEKAKSSSDNYREDDFHPKVIVSTRKTENGVEVSVSDNGFGIPDAIKDKIFQPFFTTKPTGSGTGLGLSLSYDIVKAHGGELKVSKGLDGGSSFNLSLSSV